MVQIDDTFLADLGLTNLPEDKRNKMLQQITEELEQRIGEKLTANMSEEQLAEFDSMLERDEQKVRQWLQTNLPGYEQAEDYKALLKEAGIAEGQSASAEVLADYAVVKWLAVNCPDYQKVVEETAEELKQDIIRRRNAILDDTKEE